MIKLVREVHFAVSVSPYPAGEVDSSAQGDHVVTGIGGATIAHIRSDHVILDGGQHVEVMRTIHIVHQAFDFIDHIEDRVCHVNVPRQVAAHTSRLPIDPHTVVIKPRVLRTDLKCLPRVIHPRSGDVEYNKALSA